LERQTEKHYERKHRNDVAKSGNTVALIVYFETLTCYAGWKCMTTDTPGQAQSGVKCFF
jgi:hypothetical protein